MSNIYKKHAQKYLDKGMSVIPDKFKSKQPAIKAWSDFCYRQPTEEEVKSWMTNFEEKGSGISLALGEASGIIALDVDTIDQKILDLILPILPDSPVEKKGSKGFTRFFKFMGQHTDIVKYNGEVVLEVLSNGKKTTLPPSVHPNGADYVWTSDVDLCDVNVNDLPVLPPFLISQLQLKIQAAFPSATLDSYGKVSNGRNSDLSSFLGTLIESNKGIDTIIKELIDFDKKEHEVPLFTDSDEMRHTDPISNALLFYSNHLNSINTKRFRQSKEYVVPPLQSSVDLDAVREVARKKSVVGASPKKQSNELLAALTAKLQQTYFGENNK